MYMAHGEVACFTIAIVASLTIGNFPPAEVVETGFEALACPVTNISRCPSR
jgi:hypothetical protein